MKMSYVRKMPGEGTMQLLAKQVYRYALSSLLHSAWSKGPDQDES